MSKANITVYLQALGAHFLGQHAFKVQDIRIQLVYSGGAIPLYYKWTNTNDGVPTTVFVPGTSSFMPIITVPQTAAGAAEVHFLSSDQSTVCGNAGFVLPLTIELAHLNITVPVTSGATPVLIQYPVLLNPAQSLYTLTVAVPGLYLSPDSFTGTTLSVYVKMMCGCPVTQGPPASLWPAHDFTVSARVIDISGAATLYQLTYDSTQPANSLFSAPIPATQKAIRSVTFTAMQKSTGNYGAVEVKA